MWSTRLPECPFVLGACVKWLPAPPSRLLHPGQDSQSGVSQIMNYITTKFQVIGSQSPQPWPWGQLEKRDERRSPPVKSEKETKRGQTAEAEWDSRPFKGFHRHPFPQRWRTAKSYCLQSFHFGVSFKVSSLLIKHLFHFNKTFLRGSKKLEKHICTTQPKAWLKNRV